VLFHCLISRISYFKHGGYVIGYWWNISLNVSLSSSFLVALFVLSVEVCSCNYSVFSQQNRPWTVAIDFGRFSGVCYFLFIYLFVVHLTIVSVAQTI
jgi:hypothetical protein